ncbi:MAG: protoporphyrinogen oxidase [Dermatophilus congolensis]|nr:protoporphyrinogen oxidase [Dermatophilus congolensis]
MFPPSAQPSVVVIGGGVTGLLASRRLAGAGARVTLVERGPRLGGQIRTVELGGRRVDVGAEAVHLALPSMKSVVAELGLADAVQASRPGTSWLWTGRRRVLPAGVGPAGPTQIMPVLKSGVLRPFGLVRAGLEPLAAERQGPIDLSPDHDISVGDFVTRRFGRAVSELFVDPLLGSLHSGNVDELSLRACAPSLVPAASKGTSLLRNRPAAPKRAPGTPPPVMFANWKDGLSTLTDALIDGVDLDLRLGAHVVGLSALPPDTASGQGAPRYRVALATGEALTADGVVLAVPAAVAADLISGGAPSAAATLRQTRIASTATIVLGFRRGDVSHLPALAGNGFLVPSRYGTLVKAGTHLSTKWAHLDQGDTVLVRASAGRAGSGLLDSLDDEALLDHVRRDLRTFTGIDAPPTLAHTQRWTTGLPQLTVGHPDRMTSARADLATRMPGVELAGASYDGIGIGACLTSAEKAAARLVELLDL